MSSEVQNRLVSDTTRTNALQYFLIFFLKMVRIGEKVKEVEWTNVPPAANSAGHCTSKSVANKKDSCSTNSFLKTFSVFWGELASSQHQICLNLSSLAWQPPVDWRLKIERFTLIVSPFVILLKLTSNQLSFISRFISDIKKKDREEWWSAGLLWKIISVEIFKIYWEKIQI